MLTEPELLERPLGDGHVFEVLGRWYRRDPPEALLWQAAELFEGGSPAMIQGAARWLGVAQDLRQAGLDDAEVARVLLSATAGEPPGWVPPGPVLAEVIEAAGDEIDPAAIAAELLGMEKLIRPLKILLTICAGSMAKAGAAIPESLDAHVVFHVPWPHLRAIVQGLPEARRDALLVRLIGKPSNANAARVQLRYLLPVLDLATGEGPTQAVQNIRALLEGKEQWADLLAAADAGGGPPPKRDGPTEECRKAVEYWLEKYEAMRRVAGIGETAQAVHSRTIELDAPELASFEAWNAATDERRRDIAEQVQELVFGLELRGLETFDAGPIATFTHGGLVFRLVPGGSYDRGFSPEEEALVREVAEAKRPQGDNWIEEFGAFLEEQLDTMRPLARATVGPLLVCASPGYAMEPSAVAGFLEQGPWRLPSETEWEHLARGGRAHELTWRGHEVPDELWFERTDAAGEAAANPFGLWGFGFQPELCADAWADTHEDTPVDGTPRCGEGTRVARGGAAMLYPWQQVGEWQLLCTAVRSPAIHWEFEVSVRPVLGVSP